MLTDLFWAMVFALGVVAAISFVARIVVRGRFGRCSECEDDSWT